MSLDEKNKDENVVEKMDVCCDTTKKSDLQNESLDMFGDDSGDELLAQVLEQDHDHVDKVKVKMTATRRIDSVISQWFLPASTRSVPPGLHFAL
jgi:hypothetical protein